jgi:hypothetical protein
VLVVVRISITFEAVRRACEIESDLLFGGIQGTTQQLK